jgi:hypothetical protein
MAKAAHTARVIMAITAVWPCVRLLDGLDALLSPSSPETITASPFPSISRADDDEGGDEGTDEGETDGDIEVGAVVSMSASVLVDPLTDGDIEVGTVVSTSVSVLVDPLRPLGIDVGMDMDMSGIDILM